jgi:hypothetical protein
MVFLFLSFGAPSKLLTPDTPTPPQTKRASPSSSHPAEGPRAGANYITTEAKRKLKRKRSEETPCQHGRGRQRSQCKDCGTGRCEHYGFLHGPRAVRAWHGRRNSKAGARTAARATASTGSPKAQSRDCSTGGGAASMRAGRAGARTAARAGHCQQHGRPKAQCKDCGTGYTASTGNGRNGAGTAARAAEGNARRAPEGPVQGLRHGLLKGTHGHQEGRSAARIHAVMAINKPRAGRRH